MDFPSDRLQARDSGCGKKASLFFAIFSNRMEFQSEIIPTHLVILCEHNGILSSFN